MCREPFVAAAVYCANLILALLVLRAGGGAPDRRELRVLSRTRARTAACVAPKSAVRVQVGRHSEMAGLLAMPTLLPEGELSARRVRMRKP